MKNKINSNGKSRGAADKRKLFLMGARANEGKGGKEMPKKNKNIEELECHFSMPGKIEIGG